LTVLLIYHQKNLQNYNIFLTHVQHLCPSLIVLLLYYTKSIYQYISYFTFDIHLHYPIHQY
jgi:hypothetical protein